MNQSSLDNVPLVPQRVENAIHERLKKRAQSKCKSEIQSYAQCTQERTISALWHCRTLLLDMKNCTSKYANEAEVIKFKIGYEELQREREDTGEH